MLLRSGAQVRDYRAVAHSAERRRSMYYFGGATTMTCLRFDFAGYGESREEAENTCIRCA